MFPWPDSYQELFQKRLREESPFEKRIQVCWGRLCFRLPWQAQNPETSDFIEFIECAFKVLSDHLDKADWICRNVWESHGLSIRGEFIREVVRQKVLDEMEKRSSELDQMLTLAMHNKNIENRGPVLHRFQEARQQLKERKLDTYETEVRSLDTRNDEAAPKASTESTQGESVSVNRFAVRDAPVTQSLENKAKNAPRAKLERSDPEVAKRRVLVRSNSTASAGEMCQIFDRTNVPLPTKWNEAFSTWARAYKDDNYRGRIHTLISKDRRSKN